VSTVRRGFWRIGEEIAEEEAGSRIKEDKKLV